jgi:hypothetical protein
MQTEQIVALLIAERDKLNHAIDVLLGPTKRRGRPPKNALNGATPSVAVEPSQPAKKKRRFTAAQRKLQSEKLKAYWAARKKTAVKTQPKAASKPKKTAKAA